MAIAAGDPQRANRFCDRPDPVGAGFVDSLAKPGGNATGFMTFEPGISAKWLELLKELVPGMRRTAVLRDPTITAGIGMWSAIQAVSPSLGVELRPIDVRSASEIERAVAEFARVPNGGMILTGSGLAARSDHRVGGPAQTAHDVLRTFLCWFWRPDLLWA
jgi:ABC transporter substrate binding protein